MLAELILKAETKAGDKSALARKLHEQRPRITKYANLTRKPTDTSILKLADYLGLDKGETLYKAKLELEPENVHLWEFLNWRAWRELNPRPSASEADTLSN